MALHTELNWPLAHCCCYSRDDWCVCPPMERALRGWARGESLPPMTPEQRAVCMDEIDRVEGYRSSDVADGTDAAVAAEVMNAWQDYARDKMGW